MDTDELYLADGVLGEDVFWSRQLVEAIRMVVPSPVVATAVDHRRHLGSAGVGGDGTTGNIDSRR